MRLTTGFGLISTATRGPLFTGNVALTWLSGELCMEPRNKASIKFAAASRVSVAGRSVLCGGRGSACELHVKSGLVIQQARNMGLWLLL